MLLNILISFNDDKQLGRGCSFCSFSDTTLLPPLEPSPLAVNLGCLTVGKGHPWPSG